jgi:hypothetical protein
MPALLPGSRSLRKVGCLVLIGATAIPPAADRTEGDGRLQDAANTETTTRTRLVLDVSSITLTVVPAPRGEPIRISAEFNPNRFELLEHGAWQGTEWVYTVGMHPIGSASMALLRLKLGGPESRLRISLPRGMRLQLDGRILRCFVAMELGGLGLDTAKLDIEEGAVILSFDEPLTGPMESLVVQGKKGSLAIRNIGNASPREARLEQRFGAVDLDLRGAWANDSHVTVNGNFAGGSLWLSRNVTIEGLQQGQRGFESSADPELPRPTLTLSVSLGVGRFVIVD